MKKYIFLVSCFFNFNAYADVQSQKDVETTDLSIKIDSHKILACKTIEDDSLRLRCFDENINLPVSVKKALTDDPPKQVDELSKWLVNSKVDEITDKTNYFLLKLPTSGSGSMHIRCMDNKTELFISADKFLDLEPIKVITRVDKSEPSTTYWQVSADGDVAFHPSPVKFIKSIIDKQKVAFKISAYESTEIISFDIGDLAYAVKDLRKECGW